MENSVTPTPNKILCIFGCMLESESEDCLLLQHISMVFIYGLDCYETCIVYVKLNLKPILLVT